MLEYSPLGTSSVRECPPALSDLHRCPTHGRLTLGFNEVWVAIVTGATSLRWLSLCPHALSHTHIRTCRMKPGRPMFYFCP